MLHTFYRHIIHVHLYGVHDKVLEDLFYHPLEGAPCVLKSEVHHLVAVNSPTRSTGYLISSDGCILI